MVAALAACRALAHTDYGICGLYPACADSVTHNETSYTRNRY
jgi:hypothetical protein